MLDVQGKAVENALHGLGWTGAAQVRVGRVITFDVSAASAEAAHGEVEAMCERSCWPIRSSRAGEVEIAG